MMRNNLLLSIAVSWLTPYPWWGDLLILWWIFTFCWLCDKSEAYLKRTGRWS